MPAASGRRPTRSTGPLRLSWRLLVPLVAATLLIGVGGGLAHRHFRNEIRDQAQRTLAAITEQKRQQIESWLAESRMDTELYFSGKAAIPTLLAGWLASGRQDRTLLDALRERVTEVARMRGWSGVAILGVDSRPILVAGAADTRVHADTVADILRHPRSESLDLHTDPDGSVEYGVLAPIRASGGAPLGVAYLTWQAERSIDPLVASWPIPTRSAEALLVRREGDRIRFLTPWRDRPSAGLEESLPADSPDLTSARAARGERGILEGSRDYRGVPVLAYATPVSGSPWYLIAKIDEDEAYAGVRATAWTAATGIGLGLLLVYGMGYLLWRREHHSRALSALRREQTLQAEQLRTWRLLDAIANGSTDAIFAKDTHGRYLFLNRAAAAMAGKSVADSVNRDDTALFPPEQAARLMADDRRAMDEDRTIVTEQRLATGDGDRIVQITKGPLHDAEGRPIGVFGISRDITALKRTEEALRESEERFRRLFEDSKEPMMLIEDGRFVDANRASLDMLRLESLEGLVGLTPADISPPFQPDGLSSVAKSPEMIRAALEAGSNRFEWEHLRADGERFLAEVLLTPIRLGERRVLHVVWRDITEKKRAEAQLREARDAAEAANAELRRLATTDALTGAWNRRYFEASVAAEMHRALRYRHPISLLLIDVDRFKSINDGFGHQTGDRVLGQLVRLIRDNLRTTDLLARWGGEEFVLLLPHCPADQGHKLAERLRGLIAAYPFPEVGTVTCSFGVAEFRPQESFDDWLKRADDALYGAKDGGRNATQVGY